MSFARRHREIAAEGELVEPFQSRVLLLIEKLRSMDGFIFMGQWNDCFLRRERLPEAMANPCGTACCLAGKAGLIPEFQEQGFSWYWAAGRYDGFTTSPPDFFGYLLYEAVFIGTWCMSHIHTPQQAVMVLEHLLTPDGLTSAAVSGAIWIPVLTVQEEIQKLRPAERHFPVSRRHERFNSTTRLWESITHEQRDEIVNTPQGGNS